MDDEGDYKKARGFLLTYSCLVMGLWYFKVELTHFNLMGVTLEFTHRKENIWLVVALVNAYFWFRFYQRLPRNALRFDDAMHDLYDKALVWLSVQWKRRALKRLAESIIAGLTPPPEQSKVVQYAGNATGRQSLVEELHQNSGETTELHQITREYRTKVYLTVGYTYAEDGKWILFPMTNGIHYQPGRAITWAAKAFAILRGAFVTPWFTDYFAPLAVGLLSTATALYLWWEVNFFVAGG